MKKIVKLIALLFLSFSSISIVSCGQSTNRPTTTASSTDPVDFASQLKLDTSSNRNREVVEIQQLVDGDTTHFKSTVTDDGVLKARYLGIDTPECTGKVQPWGNAAKNFTNSKLLNATEILIESEDNKWNLDSTGGRYLVYVWYRPTAGADFRNLNLEIMQEGLAAAKNITTTIYGSYFQQALNQAISLRIKYYGETDPDFYVGAPQLVSVKELRTNTEEYANIKVRFEGLVTKVSGQTAYAEAYDPDDDFTYGFTVYMGYTAYAMIKEGNVVSFCGTVQYYEAAGTWQLSGLTYMAMRPDNPDNLRLISENNEVNPRVITSTDLTSDGNKMISTFVKMENLKVTSIYTTNNGGNSDGAMTLTCQDSENKVVSIRTSVLFKSENIKVVESDLINKTIDVIGIMETFDGSLQLHVFVYEDITVR